jgi:hypothetical protein
MAVTCRGVCGVWLCPADRWHGGGRASGNLVLERQSEQGNGLFVVVGPGIDNKSIMTPC